MWVGNSQKGTEQESLVACLSFNQIDETGSILGATTRPPLAGGTEEGPLIVEGSWQRSDWRFSFRERATAATLKKHPDLALRQYEGQVMRTRKPDGSLVAMFSGRWKGVGEPDEANASDSGEFACFLERDPTAVESAGLLVGLAHPDDSLKDFLVPTNPVQWSLGLLAAEEGQESGKALGGGLFDDALDVPGQPRLYFSVSGEWRREAEGLRVLLRKEYEAYPETDGVQVTYEGLLTLGGGEDCPLGEIAGEWRNQTHHTFGQFVARLQPAVSEERGNVLNSCEACGAPIKPGSVRWSRRGDPLGSDFLCPSCFVDCPEPSRFYPGVYSAVTAISGTCTADLLLKAFATFSSNPFLGLLSPSPALPPDGSPIGITSTPPQQVEEGLYLKWYTYADFQRLMMEVAIFLSLSLPAPVARRPILFCSNSSPTSAVLQFAALVSTAILVPVPVTLDSEAAAQILRKTRPLACFTSPDAVDFLAALFQLDDDGNVCDLPLLILQDCAIEHAPSFPAPPAALSSYRGPQTTLSQVLLTGRHLLAENPSFDPFPQRQLGAHEVVAILFTSGTTSLGASVKGAPFEEHHFYPSEGTCNVLPYVRIDFQPYDPTFALSIVQSCQCGSQRVFARGLDTLLTTDCRLLRPTHIGASPTFWTNIHQLYLSELGSSVGVTTAAASSQSSAPSWELIQDRAAKKIKALLGNRLLGATVGGARCPPETLKFLQDVMHIDIAELYGSRETGGIARNGVVYAAVTVCLLPVDELGFEGTPIPNGSSLSSFLENGRTYKGEICVATPRLIAGYHELDNPSFFPYGSPPRTFYRTGDIGELWRDGNNRHVRVLDRAGSLMKLNHGHWISPSKIEGVLEQSPDVDQAFVTGLPHQPLPVAVIVPSRRFTAFWQTDSDTNAATPAAVARQLWTELHRWCLHHGLCAYEIPAVLHLDRERWTDANGMITSTEKKKRLALTRRYDSVRDELYQSLATPSATSSDSDGKQPACDPRFLEALTTIFPAARLSHVTATTLLSEIGGDSISAAMLSALLRQRNISISAVDLFKFPLSHLSDLFTSERPHIYGTQYSPPSIDWEDAMRLPADVIAELQSNATPVGASVPAGSGHVCLIGATGFLGPALVAEVLRQSPREVQLLCVIRASSSGAAMERLKEELQEARLWEALSESDSISRIRCFNGDLSSPTLGLSQELYAELLDGLRHGHVIHNAARVNMLIPYQGLAGTNVAGTLHVLKLASRARARLHFISSVAAVGSRDVGERFIKLEARELERKDGYGQTKAVSEAHLTAAMSIDTHLDVRIYRPSAISGHSLSGYTNRTDFFSSLIQAVAKVNAAPISEAASKLLHWIPVDFVATSIIAISLSNAPEARGGVFHFTQSGPNFAAALAVLRNHFLPDLRNITVPEWQQLVDALRSRKEISESHYPLLSNVSWGDKSATFSLGVDTRATQLFLQQHCSLSFPSPVDDSAILLSLNYLRSIRHF
ncbi:MAG: thioester reductase domain-containing protein [archaeon]|nr:thioester reductase domain-containing protein [archaeon]